MEGKKAIWWLCTIVSAFRISLQPQPSLSAKWVDSHKDLAPKSKTFLSRVIATVVKSDFDS